MKLKFEAIKASWGHFWVTRINDELTMFNDTADRALTRYCRLEELSLKKQPDGSDAVFELTVSKRRLPDSVCIEYAGISGTAIIAGTLYEYALPKPIQTRQLKTVQICDTRLRQLFGKIPDRIYFRLKRISP